VAYFVRCRDGSLYGGASNDVARRVLAHNRGQGAAYTRSRRPVQLVYVERAADRSDALRREARLKRLSRAEKLELVRRAARRRSSRRNR
jgi:putative endonuclease